MAKSPDILQSTSWDKGRRHLIVETVEPLSPHLDDVLIQVDTGSLTIMGEDVDQPTLTIQRIIPAINKTRAGKILRRKEGRLSVQQSDTFLMIEEDREIRWGHIFLPSRTPQTNIALSIPTSSLAQYDLEILHGDITVTNVEAADCVLKTNHSGDTTVLSSSGTFSIDSRTYGHKVNIEGFTGTIEANTWNSPILGKDVQGGVKLKSDRHEISLDNTTIKGTKNRAEALRIAIQVANKPVVIKATAENGVIKLGDGFTATKSKPPEADPNNFVVYLGDKEKEDETIKDNRLTLLAPRGIIYLSVRNES